MADREFCIGDVVSLDWYPGAYLRVSGVIHDSQRLFLTDDLGLVFGGKEFETGFNNVGLQWQLSKFDRAQA